MLKDGSKSGVLPPTDLPLHQPSDLGGIESAPGLGSGLDEIDPLKGRHKGEQFLLAHFLGRESTPLFGSLNHRAYFQVRERELLGKQRVSPLISIGFSMLCAAVVPGRAATRNAQLRPRPRSSNARGS